MNTITSATFQMLRMIRKVLHLLPQESQQIVITSLILSKLDYCNSLYLNIQQQHLNKLQLLQDAAARLLKREIRKLYWLPIRQRVRFKSLCMAFKSLHDVGPDHLRQCFSWYTPTRILHSLGAKMVLVPKFKTANWRGRRFVTCTARA